MDDKRAREAFYQFNGIIEKNVNARKRAPSYSISRSLQRKRLTIIAEKDGAIKKDNVTGDGAISPGITGLKTFDTVNVQSGDNGLREIPIDLGNLTKRY